MGIHRFNPSEPCCNPVHPPPWVIGGLTTDGRCGNCHCVPCRWVVTMPFGGFLGYGPFVLERLTYGEETSFCLWRTAEQFNINGVPKRLYLGYAFWRSRFNLDEEVLTEWAVVLTHVDAVAGQDQGGIEVTGDAVHVHAGSRKVTDKPFPFACLRPNEFLPYDMLNTNPNLGSLVIAQPSYL